jgi:integral membrane protein
MLKTTLGRLRLIGFAEGISFLVLLFIAMPLKYAMDMPQAVKVTGMAHGVLFIMYVLAVILAAVEYSWNAKKVAIALVASILPFGPFYADAKIFKAEAK